MPNYLPMHYGTALIMGLIAGTSYCAAGCAPFLSTYVMGTGMRISDGMRSYGFFSLGRILTYSLLGMASVMVGRVLILSAEGPSISYFSGAVLFLLGIIIFFKPSAHPCKRNSVSAGLTPRNIVFNGPVHLIVAGALFAAMPCPPLLGMITYSLQLQSTFSGIMVMVLFGLGTLISPLIVTAFLAGLFAKKIKNKAPQHIMLFQRAAGVILMMMGCYKVII